jgi:serine O-acetyltransferase
MICHSIGECFKVDLRRMEPNITFLKCVTRCFTESRVLAAVLLRISQYLWRKRLVWRAAPWIKRFNEILTGFECHLEACLGEGLLIAHTQDCVVGEGVTVGKNVTLYNGVTLGAVARNRGKEAQRYPNIQDNVTIYSGAKVLGPITIGEGAIVGANAVVLQDVPPGCIAVGVPARILDRKASDSTIE